MKENGFYIYTPTEEAAQEMCELSLHQVIQVIEGEVWLTGCPETFDMDYVEAMGVIGAMVMSEDGKYVVGTFK